MKTYWGENKFHYNNEICFSCIIKGNSAQKLNIIAKDIYNVFINGKFICYGPARAAKGYARVDEIDISNYLIRGENRISVFVQSNNTKAMCFATGNPYFGCEIIDGEKVIKDTSDFDCYHMVDKIVKVEKMSYQRTFCEVYNQKEDRMAFTSGYELINKVEVPTPILLKRGVSFSKNEEEESVFLKEGFANLDGEVTWCNDYTNFQLDNGINLFGYTRAECDEKLSLELDKMVFDKGGNLKYKTYAFNYVCVGKFKLKLKVLKKSTLYLIYDDLLVEGNVKFNREQIIHGLKWTLEKGEYTLYSNEVYQAKYISLVYDGEIEIKKVSIIKIENPDVDLSQFKVDDEEINLIISSAIRTFVHNAYDLPTDCASRERAGYLCDGFFNARAEKLFTGENKVERNLLENYLYFSNELYEHKGILPMCYPSSPKGKDDYIPNWILWYVVQLGDCLIRTGDWEFVKKHEQRVRDALEFFEGYENEYGLLENLDGWVFVEWSRANDFVNGVNFPTNMLYYGALLVAGKLLSDKKYIEKAEKIKTAIYRFSFDGQLFVDNAIREDGKLIVTGNTSETCQNYAAFFNIVTAKESPDFYKSFEKRFGALDIKAERKVWKSNMFIGFVLRLEVLFREGKYKLLLKESKEAFLPMVQKTGTIWEHFEDHSSCNHGFGSEIGRLVYESYKNLEKGVE